MPKFPFPSVTTFRSLVALAAILAPVILTHGAEKSQADAKSDEAAIRAAVESYTAAYNRSDAKAVASHWSDSGEWTSPSGQRFQGRAAIEKELQSLFAENKGVRIEVVSPRIRILSADAAVEEGVVRVFRPSEPPSESTYLAVHVKKGGKWKLDSVHETEMPSEPPADSPLQDLEWLVGDWTNGSPNAAAAASVTWAKNKSFLHYSFKASAPGMDDLEGAQIIGWDPAAGTIRSWMFDSDGGFGEGVWTRKDNTWTVKFSQTLPDGRKASATNLYTRVNDNTIVWKSIGRKVDGQFLPNVEDVKLVRKAAGGAAKETGKAAEKPSKSGAKK